MGGSFHLSRDRRWLAIRIVPQLCPPRSYFRGREQFEVLDLQRYPVSSS